MKTLPPTGLIIEENPAIAAAIRDYHRCGGVLDIRTCTSADSAPNHRHHLRAATYTLHSVIAARSAERQQLAARAGADILPDAYRQHFPLAEQHGRRISAADFWGPTYEPARQRLLIRAQENRYYRHDAAITPDNAVILRENTPAFCHAFLEPPYPATFGRNIRESGQYFLDFCTLLFGTLHDIEAYTWDTACSDYFDAGKEWWGAHFWTVYSPHNGRYTGIIASATD